MTEEEEELFLTQLLVKRHNTNKLMKQFPISTKKVQY